MIKKTIQLSIVGSLLFTISVFATSEVHKGYSDTAAQYEVEGNIISNVDTKAPLWNPRGKSEKLLAERSAYLAKAYDLTRTDAQNKRAQKAHDKYRDAIYINSLMIGTIGEVEVTKAQFIKGIERNLAAGATVVSATAYAFPSDGPMPVLERMDRTNKVMKEQGYLSVNSVEEIRQAKKEGKIAVIFNTQGAEYAIDDLSMLDKAHSKGLRVVNLIYNNDNAFAGGGSKQASGITPLGIKFVERANKLGIVMDCSHTSNQTCIDIAKHTDKPMIASHSNPAALKKMGRNMSDEAMKAVASTGGVVCSVGVGLFMNDEGDSSPEKLVEQIDYTAKLIGKDRTCYATDYMHNADDFFKKSLGDVKIFPPEKGFGMPATNIGTEHVWDVVALLEDKYGWTEDEIKGFLGENLMRIYKANWSK